MKTSMLRRPRKSIIIQGLCWVILLPMCLSAHDDDDKRQLEHSDYDRWNTIGQQSISNDGQWVLYSVQPGKGDATLKIRHTQSDRQYSILRGSGARFSFDSKYVIYTIAPDPELIKKLRKEKKKPEELPKSKLEILHLPSGGHTTIDRVQSFSLPEKSSGQLAYLLHKPVEEKTVEQEKSNVSGTYEVTPSGLKKTEPSQPAKALEKQTEKQPESKQAEKEGPATSTQSAPEETGEQQKGQEKEKEKATGSTLVLRNLGTGVEQRFPNAVSYRFSKFGKRLAFATSAKEATDDGVFVVTVLDGSAAQIISGRGNYRSIVFDETEDQIALLSDRDDYAAEQPSWSLYHWKSHQKQADKIADHQSTGIPENWWVASTAAPAFTEDGRRLLFSTAPKPEDLGKKEDEDEDAEPKAKLDLWHWQDPLLQPQQLLQAERERRRSYRAAYDLRSKKIAQLADLEVPNVIVDPRSKADIAVGISSEKYDKMRSWESPGYQDVYLVDLKSGERQLVLEKSRGSASLSPEGKYITWWDPEQRKWLAMSTAKREAIELSQGIQFPVHNELHDTPSPPRPYGSAGWLSGDAAYLIYDRHDIWQVDPTGSAQPKCITQNAGRAGKLRFRRVSLDPEERSIDPAAPMLLSTFDEVAKGSGYSQVELSGDEPVHGLIMLDESIGRLSKARDTSDVIFTRSTFQRCPDIWFSSTEFKKVQRISRINPQQHEYLWGTAELVHWTADDGQALDGLLYKPEGFDPQKKYPMMVYYYERNSDNLHRYHTPTAGRSSISYSFYVSRGYLLFVPDIPYKTGQPGQSAFNSVVSGVRSLIEQGFVDEKGIGMQGHSWGGYQAAYIVTQTDMFACAEAGAPVSNMTSAYGGIRWGSGMSRMFQYERTQSRIGDTLWQARDKYLENSPLFYADKVNTPLLILHNDEDGAVPWYQGIELFVALRRLEKPAWMVNYNGEPHGITKDENRRDFAVRMQQFFDHYCKGAAAPKWLANGIPAVDKGKDFGLELLEPEPESEEAQTSESGDKK